MTWLSGKWRAGQDPRAARSVVAIRARTGQRRSDQPVPDQPFETLTGGRCRVEMRSVACGRAGMRSVACSPAEMRSVGCPDIGQLTDRCQGS